LREKNKSITSFYNMSVYGYSQSLQAGDMYSARTQAYNDGVRAHNQAQTVKYHAAVKAQVGHLADDDTQRHVDESIQGVGRGEAFISSTAGTIEGISGVAKNGANYFKMAKEQRLNTIGTTAKRLIAGKKAGALPPTDPPPIDPAEVERQASLGVDTVAADAAKAQSETTAALAVADAAKAGEASGEIASSGLGTAVIKAGLSKVPGVAAGLGEAGLSTVSEIAGKAAGEAGGAIDLVKSISNLEDGKSWFGNDDATQKWGDSLQEAGAAMDLIGTAFPPLEVLGGITGLVGGMLDGYDEIKKDLDKKKTDAATITAPTPDKLKVSPAYQSLGLVASAPVSSKVQITGSTTF
jgi:hypothetical protein